MSSSTIKSRDIWRIPGTFKDPCSGDTYNLEDDCELLKKWTLDEKDHPRDIRKRWQIPSTAPYLVDPNEAVGLEYDPDARGYRYVSVPFVHPDPDDCDDDGDEKKYETDTEIKINNTYTGDEHINMDNIDRMMSQKDDDYATSTSGTSSGSGVSSYWYEQWEVMAKHYKQQSKREEETWNIRTREELSLDELRDINSGSGDDRLAKIHKTLESFGSLKRAPHQVQFQRHLITSCLPHIYKGEWEWNQLRILKQHNLTRINYEVFIIAPRRFGKTYTISMMVAALLLCVPNIRIIVLSTCKRASLSLARTVKKFIELSTIHDGAGRIHKMSEEELFIKPAATLDNGDDDDNGKANKKKKRRYEAEDDLSRLYSFPGNSKGRERDKKV
jgi:hypothetical protein